MNRILSIVAGCAILAGFGGCGTYVPEGQLVVSVKNSRHEFERADLRATNNELAQGAVIPMKWYDTNTFLTSGSLQPGTYAFRARNYAGAAMSRDIRITAEEDLYEIDAGADASAAAAATEGPVVKGKLQGGGAGKGAATVAVLFIGKEVVMQTVQVDAGGGFSAKAPAKGSWKIEVHLLGDKPLSYVHPVTNVAGPLDLGVVALK